MATGPAPSSASTQPALSLSDGELKWLYRLAAGGHAALTTTLGGQQDRLPVDCRDAMWKIASEVERRGVLDD